MKIHILPHPAGAMLVISEVKTRAFGELLVKGTGGTLHHHYPDTNVDTFVTSKKMLKKVLWNLLTSEEARGEDLWVEEVNMKPHISRFVIARSTEVDLEALAKENGCNVKLGKTAEVMGIYSCLFEAVWEFCSQETALTVV